MTEGLGYEQAGITLDRGFVITNDRLHTGVGNIYAVGDIVPGLQLAHRGFMQGIFVAEEIAGLNPTMQADINIPRVTFCEPEIASVGMTEKQAREKFGDQVRTVEYNLAGNGKSSILATSGIIKLVSVEGGPIVGFHGIGARIGEQISEGELMVNWEAYPSDEGAGTTWRKRGGDTGELDEPIVEVSTDKVDSEVPSPVAGVLLEILVPEDETVEVGTVVAIISSSAPTAASAAEAAAPAAPAAKHAPKNTKCL